MTDSARLARCARPLPYALATLGLLVACGRPYESAGDDAGGAAGLGGAAGSGGSAGSGATSALGGTGGVGGSGGSGGSGATCDPSASPADNPCAIDDEFAVFVSALNGSATHGNGTKGAPFAEVEAGIEEAKATGRRLFICGDAGHYDENIMLHVGLAGIEVWGSFKCEDWEFDRTLKATIAPTSGVPLTAQDLDEVTSFHHLRFLAPPGKTEGSPALVNSIAAFVVSSPLLHFNQVAFEAQAGGQGAGGGRTDLEPPAPHLINGKSATNLDHAPEVSFTCTNTNEVTTGGDGGSGHYAAGSGSAGQPNRGGGLPGQIGALCTGAGGGQPGGPGATGRPGGGAQRLGALTSSGWAPAAGDPGGFGTVGQGGGGGRGQSNENGLGGGGGGGGAGGCGGAPGGGGSGGGASIALLLFNSPVRLTQVTLKAGQGGRGGDGADGQPGLPGGSGGNGHNAACGGGQGGQGGKGGRGGGGAGGISASVAYVGLPPERQGGSATFEGGGQGGVGGDPVAINGQSAMELNLN